MVSPPSLPVSSAAMVLSIRAATALVGAWHPSYYLPKRVVRKTYLYLLALLLYGGALLLLGLLVTLLSLLLLHL